MDEEERPVCGEELGSSLLIAGCSAHVYGILWVNEKARGLVGEGTSGQEGKWTRGQVDELTGGQAGWLTGGQANKLTRIQVGRLMIGLADPFFRRAVGGEPNEKGIKKRPISKVSLLMVRGCLHLDAQADVHLNLVYWPPW